MLLQPYHTPKYQGIMLVGEAAGAEEEKQGLPFVGASGKLLDEMLLEAGLERDMCVITNVFMIVRPPGNDINYFFVGIQKAEKDNILYEANIARYGGKYLRTEFGGELGRLGREIEEFNPKIIVPMGNTALWGILGIGGITTARGNEYWSRRYKRTVVPTWHPAAVIRNRTDKKPEAILDFQMVKEYL